MRRLLAGLLGGLQLLRQARGVLLQSEQGALALFVLAEVLVQLSILLGQPGLTAARVLRQQRGCQRMGCQAWGQALLLGEQLFVLLQQFFLLGDHTADFGPQFGEGFLEQVDGLLGSGLFAFIMSTQALQQGFGLVVGVLDTATHRAGLIVLQLPAQLLDTGAAGQALALQKRLGDRQCLLGHGQVGLGFYAFAGQAFAFALGAVQALLQGLPAGIQLLLVGPQPRQLFHRPQLLAVVLQQAAENLDLLGDCLRLDVGFAVQHLQLLTLFFQAAGAGAGLLLQPQQFRLTLFEAIAHQHQLLQALAVQVPGVADRRPLQAVLQLAGDIDQAFGHLLLLFEHLGDGVLALQARLFGGLLEFCRRVDRLGQSRQVALFLECLAQQRGIAGVLVLRLGQRRLGRFQAQFQLRLTGQLFGLLGAVLLDRCGQGAQLGIKFGLTGKLVTLRCQVLQALEVQPCVRLGIPGLPGLLQLLDTRLLLVLDLLQFLEPGVLQLQLLELGLLGLELLLGLAQTLVEFGARLGLQGGDAAGLVL